MSTQYPAEVFRWMLTSLQTVPIFYGVIPVKELYKVFESGKEKHPAVGDISEKDYTEMLRTMLAIANHTELAGTPGLFAVGITCKFDGNELIPIDSDVLVKAVRSEKKKDPVKLDDYRILTYDEVMQVLQKGYIETPEATAMENYLKTRWKMSEDDAVGLVRHFSIGFRTGEDMPQESVNELIGILGIHELTQDEMMEILNILVQLYNGTGQMSRNGWPPNELYEKRYGQKAPVINGRFEESPNVSPTEILKNLKPGSKVMPGSSHMAAILKAHEAELKARGIEVDYEVSASRYHDTRVTPEGTTQRTRGQKVYPNDPCPCGSGRKYKYCHGMR
ncbi:MAG: SEC-C domain-containing protein [Clostridia bacterium]|nr:SEC-C domain-containing protein [Clostridia bacterium]